MTPAREAPALCTQTLRNGFRCFGRLRFVLHDTVVVLSCDFCNHVEDVQRVVEEAPASADEPRQSP